MKGEGRRDQEQGVIWYARVVFLGIDLFVLNVITYRRLISAGWTFGRRHR